MKKLALIAIMLCSSPALAEVEYYGTISGSVKDLNQEAQSMCAKHDGYFVDHYNMQHKALSGENNLYTSFSANIVCVNKPTEKQ